jgi:cytochrome c5
MTRRTIRAATLVSMLAACLPVAAGAQADVRAANAPLRARASLPDAPGIDVAQAVCTGCHGAALIVGQRLTRNGWDREVAKMERWSRPVPPSDRDRLIDYLAAHFGVADNPLPAVGPGARGREVHDRACLTCHDDGFTRAQRLNAAGWRRTVAKMVGWGAPVPPDDVDALVAFLQTSSPPAR